MVVNAATISYGDWSKDGSDTVIPVFTVNDDVVGVFRVDIKIDIDDSPNDYAKVTGVYFDLGNDDIVEADITNEDPMAHTDFATNASEIHGVTELNQGDFEVVLGYKDRSNKSDLPMYFYVSDHDGALTLADWGRVGIRFQVVGENDFGEGSDKEVSLTSAIVPDNTPNPVPLPAAVWLFGSAFVGLMGVARKRTKVA